MREWWRNDRRSRIWWRNDMGRGDAMKMEMGNAEKVKKLHGKRRHDGGGTWRAQTW